MARVLTAIVFAMAAASCAPNYTLVIDQPAKELREETFQYRKWLKNEIEPDTVVIALHGFSGASIDYENLATHLVGEHHRCALYAYEIRGQGRDPKKERRGDIDDPANWSTDLLAFTDLVRRRHPEARIVWFGESMGALILSHTYRQEILAQRKPPCDAIGVTSPVVTFRDDFPKWKKGLVRTLSQVAPKARITLETLSGGQDVQMTEDSVHSEQAETNSWNVGSHTLRLLSALGNLIEEMPECAASFRVPTLVVHGGKDFFTRPDDVKDFAERIPETTRHRRLFYPEGHHLLMYDRIKDKVIADIANWLDGLGQSSK